MSEQEEPVAKLAKLEGSMESMDEGQEEWLSEGVLTDDDLNPTAENDSSAVQSQDEAMEQVEETTELPKEQTEAPEVDEEKQQNGDDQNTDKIEEALDNMENEKTDKIEEEITGDLGTFLVRKTDGTIIETRERRDDSDIESPRHTDEDANDTDELLRMLGDDDQKAKKKKEVRKIVENKTNNDQSSDEEDIFTGKVTRLKSKLGKKVPTKAVPEVTSDDESTKLKSRLRTPKKPILKKTPSKGKSSGGSDEEHNMTYKVKEQKKVATKAVPELSDDDSSNDRSTMKKMFSAKKKVHFAAKSTAKSALSAKHSSQAQREKEAARRLEALKKAQKVKPAPMKLETDEVIRWEEFLEDDAFDMDEYREELDAEIRGEGGNKRQKLMRPEQMDEEFLSDDDSASDDNSYYDELPSTDSEEELEDWFTFDIRAERAGDYLPLLGDRAHQVLSEERARLAGRVSSLRFDLGAAAAAARAHAAQLRRAAAAVAELDAAIKAAA